MRVEVFDRMEEATEAEVQRLLPLVGPQRREQALHYKHTMGQYCCLKSWLMVQNLWNGVMPEWTYNDHGKPIVLGGPHFSISHCREAIAVAVDDRPIGIDIEAIRHADKDLITRVMCAYEQEQIALSDQPDRTFIRLWTQKEAVVKAQGTGITGFEQLQNLLLTAYNIETTENEKYIYSIAINIR